MMSSEPSISASSSPTEYDAIEGLLGADGGEAAVLAPREPDWIDAWLTEQLQDDPVDTSADGLPAEAVAPTAVQFLDQLQQPPIDLLQRLTGVDHVSLSPDDGSSDGDSRLRPWRLRHAMQGLHHGVLVLPWFRAARLVHAARLEGLRVEILPAGVGSPEVPDAVELASLGLPEPLVTELKERGVTTVGELRAMTRAALLELDFPMTVVAAVHRLRGRADTASVSGSARHASAFSLDPFQDLDDVALGSLREAAEAELKRRVDVRLPADVVGGCEPHARRRLEDEIRRLESRRRRAELAVRADEIVELLAHV